MKKLKNSSLVEKLVDNASYHFSDFSISNFQNAKTNKRMALNALKKKKRYDKQLQQIDGTLTTIEQQREALEGANTNTAVLQTMKRLMDITTPKLLNPR